MHDCFDQQSWGTPIPTSQSMYDDVSVCSDLTGPLAADTDSGGAPCLGTWCPRWAGSSSNGAWEGRRSDMVSMKVLRSLLFLLTSYHSWENYMPAARLALYQLGIEYDENPVKLFFLALSSRPESILHQMQTISPRGLRRCNI